MGDRNMTRVSQAEFQGKVLASLDFIKEGHERNRDDIKALHSHVDEQVEMLRMKISELNEILNSKGVNGAVIKTTLALFGTWLSGLTALVIYIVRG